MRSFATVKDILDFAIGEEEQAHAFYSELAARMGDAAMGRTLTAFAAEELGHKQKLLAYRAGERSLGAGGQVADLQLADYLVEVAPSPTMSYQDALILAMKKEKAAFRLYSDLAEQTTDAALRGLLLSLAQEEAKHKLRFEIAYDDEVLNDQ